MHHIVVRSEGIDRHGRFELQELKKERALRTWERALAWLRNTTPGAPAVPSSKGKHRAVGDSVELHVASHQFEQNLKQCFAIFLPLQITITDTLPDSHTAPWTMTTTRVVSSCSLLASRRSRGTNAAP